MISQAIGAKAAPEAVWMDEAFGPLAPAEH
jgi:hypothetical protein